MKQTITQTSRKGKNALRLAFLGLCALLAFQASAQYNLELDTMSYPSPPTGPSIANVTAEVRRNTTGTTFTTYTPTIEVTCSFTDQAYSSVTGNVTGTALQFGSGSNSSATTPTAYSVWALMNTVSTPASTSFTGNPYGATGTEIDVATNYAFNLFTGTRALQAAAKPTNAKHYMGQLTFTFSRPISNPVIHVVGLGGFSTTSSVVLGFTTELSLYNTSAAVLSKLSGTTELNVNDSMITNGAANPAAVSGSGAASGSIRATGDNITTLVFNVYIRGDGNNSTWENSATAYAGDRWLLGFSMSEPTIAGNVFNDANGLVDNMVNGTGTNVGGSLYVNLVDGTTGNVAKRAKVGTDGAYLFQDIQPAGFPRTYSVRLSTIAGTIGSAPPATTLSSAYTHTGSFLGTGTGGSNSTPGILGSITLTNAATVITNANFGIEQIPVVTAYNAARQANPGGTTQVVVPFSAYSGNDAEDGTYASRLAGRKVTLNAATNGTLYYKGVAVSSTTTDASFDPTQVTMDPAGTTATTAVATSFTYMTYDAADKASVTKTVNLPVDAALALSGNVWDDANGDAIKSSENFTNAGGLFAVLTDNSSNAVESVSVNASGAYAFTRSTSSETYKVVLTTATATIGEVFNTSTLPSPANGAWVHTGVNQGSANTSNKTGIISVTMASTAVTNQNFGIEQKPVADAKAFTAPNTAFTKNTGITIGGNATWSIQSNSTQLSGSSPRSLSGTDQEDCATTSSCNTSTSTTFYIATINSNTVLYYNGNPLLAGASITNFDASLLTIYGQKGQGNTAPTRIGFTYAQTDRAGVTSPAVAYTIQSSQPLPLSLTAFGARAAGCNADIYWNSANELNGDYYAVERSNDGVEFRQIATVRCAKSGSAYSAKAEGISAHNYFRLKRVEVDGGFGYSETISLLANPCGGATVSILPNPVRDRLIISGLEGVGTKVMLYNSLGALINTLDATQASESMDMTAFPAGTYHVQVRSADGAVLSATSIVKE